MKQPIPVYLPKDNVNDESVTLLAWHVANGEAVRQEQPIAEIETSKATMEVPAPASGIIQYLHPVGAELRVGALLCIISEDGNAPFPRAAEEICAISPHSNADAHAPPAASAPATFDSQAASLSAPSPARFSRPARLLLEKHRIDPAVFYQRGLIRSREILEYLRAREKEGTPPVSQTSLGPPPARAASDPPSPPAPSAVVPVAGVPVTIKPMARSKRLENRHLRRSHAHVLPSSVTITCPTWGWNTEDSPTRIRFSAVLIYEMARLLRQFPEFNACAVEDRIHYYQDIHIGWAVDADKGLKVPVVHHADRQSLEAIASGLRETLIKYLNDELSLEDLAGATFTITDLSREGVLTFTPLINQGQSAILGIGADTFVPGTGQGMRNFVLAFDHQLAAGRQAAQLLHELASRIQAYEQALAMEQAAKTPRVEPYCRRCERTFSALREIHASLIPEIQDDGTYRHLCSLCLRGF